MAPNANCKIAVLPGHGMGHEVVALCVEVLRSAADQLVPTRDDRTLAGTA
jgi:isocitrate/isopropylmalate dehydrogenase